MTNLGQDAPIVKTTTTHARNVSRQAIVAELENIGVNASLFESLTIDQLSDLLYNLNKVIINSNGNPMNSQRTKGVILSAVDRKILKALLECGGNPSSLQLSRELDIPLSTVQRRRKRLEEEFISESYGLRYEKFGKRHITFIVSLGVGDRSEVTKEILVLEKVSALTRTFGDGADLKVEAILDSNQEFIEISEKIKSISGIQKISWFESIEVVGRKKETDLSIIGSG
ncbi:transcriptional regulator [Candidatus Nitrososphaera evergladensis SR1]|uniref:Transcriptional regulator n=1 Tax=Candidatus Nitrososphaera evergladensis SR1 TaxID=1459636 RepID=A0A075MT31_9ARCH|nr:Lrp/AsnC family transcriptional regulator [Candidatus Nitrososphaera evergladensis]AIF83957.1 transcriptional regulator [Candidatus Nitrososphaera evergladensis SR1]